MGDEEREDARHRGERRGPMGRLLAPLLVRRARAYARDCVGYLVLPAAMLPIGIPLAMHIGDAGTARAVALVSSAIPPLLAALWAARAESGPRASTWGKRREGLRLETMRGGPGGPDGADGPDGARVPFARAFVRNLVKIAIPWQLGHVVAVGAVYGDFDTGAAGTMVATVLLYGVVIALVGTVMLGSGRGIHDRIAATRVVGDRR
ncbi:hypothetical protein Bra3105_16875 [Brachybacterium halotolerans subsp. kimchii]|uniref:hypothetical protein n=1 Tax=Brachybacterium halotolerans TaxID=2795215 RepID=UPI001E4A0F80|nr:hypothetical protein [Brachybacterium halotolerans]UEJ82485.1 hypothetical protein Bra3105_16875 [Brachybacterium halotolerans subsp. kimchii]